MKVLHVTPYFAPALRYGGPIHTVVGLCRGLGDADVDVDVLTTTADGDGDIAGEMVRRGEYDGIPVRYLRAGFPRRFFNAHGLVQALREALSAVDLVHVHGLWSFPAWRASRESLRSGVPFVVSPRGMLDAGSLAHHRWRKRLGYWARERRYLRRASFLHATSPSEEESLRRLELGPPIVRVPNGVSFPRAVDGGRLRGRFGIDGDDKLVVFLGRLHPIKRLDLLISAFDCVRDHLDDARLVLAGPRDGLDPSAVIGRAAHADAVHWAGEVEADDKWALLARANVLVSCSDSESFGMSVVEAMAMGTPVVTTKTCPWQEVETERAGFWVPQRAEAIASAIANVLTDERVAEEMGERGRALVRERYQWSAIGRTMSSHYRSVVA